MRRILSMAWKEVLQIKRDRRMILIMLLAPLVQVILFGYVANTEVRNIALGVHDPHPTVYSRELVAVLNESGYFSVRIMADSQARLQRELESGTIAVGLALPPDFARQLARGRKVTVGLWIDGSDSNNATIAQNNILACLRRYSIRLTTARLVRSGRRAPASPLEIRSRVWYNPDLRAANYMVPAVIALVLMITTMLLTALSVVKERERGTLEQILVTPIRPWELVAGKLLPYPIIGLGEVLLVTCLAVAWFRIPVRGSLFLLFGFSGVFLLSTLGLGLLISTFCRSQQQAMMVTFLILAPNMLLSGFIVPVTNMPAPIQALSCLMPGRYFLEIVRGVFLKGTGFSLLWTQAAALATMSLALLGLAAARFRRNLI